MRKGFFDKVLYFSLLCCLPATALAQGPGDDSIYAFSGDAAVVSKYIWRGQRLTNDWSLQPSVTLGIGEFSFNVWGSLDLTAVNEGDALFLPENPLTPGKSGLKGKFSEVDYTFSFARSFEEVSLDVGTIFYTFPERSASLATTTELYGSISFDTLPWAPSATLYLDVDETGASGDTALYFLLGAGNSYDLPHDIFTGADLSVSLGFVNGGFGEFYYGASEAGAHDFNLTVSLPISLDESWSAGAFLSYSALLGDFRNFQFQDPRKVHLGTAGSPATFADTIWGGLTLSLAF